jgi:hypothetical protein
MQRQPAKHPRLKLDLSGIKYWQMQWPMRRISSSFVRVNSAWPHQLFSGRGNFSVQDLERVRRGFTQAFQA